MKSIRLINASDIGEYPRRLTSAMITVMFQRYEYQYNCQKKNVCKG